MGNILFLTLDLFRKTGGIQQVNKLLIQVLENLVSQTDHPCRLVHFSLYDDVRQVQHLRPSLFSKHYFFSGSKIRFLANCLRQCSDTKMLILSHIHLLPVAMLLALIKPGLRIILLAHGDEIRRKLPILTAYFLIRKTEIWAVSSFIAQHLKDKLGDSIHVRVLNNALPPDFILPSNFSKPENLLKKHGLSPAQKVMLTVCRISTYTHDKGVERVLNSLPHLLRYVPDILYFIIGPTEPDEQARLDKMIRALNIQKHVKFLHQIPQNLLTDYYLLADVFVMPSKKEGFGIAFIEAAACGCRIVAGNADGSRDAVLHGKLGTLIDPENNVQLRAAIINHLSIPRDTKKAEAIHNLCFQHFSVQAYQERVLRLLDGPLLCIRHA